MKVSERLLNGSFQPAHLTCVISLLLLCASLPVSWSMKMATTTRRNLQSMLVDTDPLSIIVRNNVSFRKFVTMSTKLDFNDETSCYVMCGLILVSISSA